MTTFTYLNYSNLSELISSDQIIQLDAALFDLYSENCSQITPSSLAIASKTDEDLCLTFLVLCELSHICTKIIEVVCPQESTPFAYLNREEELTQEFECELCQKMHIPDAECETFIVFELKPDLRIKKKAQQRQPKIKTSLLSLRRLAIPTIVLTQKDTLLYK